MHKWTIGWSEYLVHYDVNGEESMFETIGECIEEVPPEDLREAVEEMVERFLNVGAELSDDPAAYYPDMDSATVVESLVGPIERGATETHHEEWSGSDVFTEFGVELVTAPYVFTEFGVETVTAPQ